MTFRFKTVLGIVLIQAVLLGLLLFTGLHYLRQSAEAQFDQRSQATVRAFSVAAGNALIASDLGALDALTRDMLSYPGVLLARVRDADARVVAQAGNPARVQQVAASSGEDDVRLAGADVVQSGTRFGRIELAMSAADLQAQLAQAQRYSLALGLSGTLLVALLAWVFGAYLTRQLQDLADGSARLQSGELGLQIPVRGRDELGAAASAFNRMSAQLEASYGELERRARDLRLVMANIVDGVLTLDAAGVVLAASPPAERILGLPATQLRGRTLASLFSNEAAAAVEAALRAQPAADDAPGVHPLQLPAPRPGAEHGTLELQFSRIEGAGADPGEPAALAVLRDVTRRVEDEAQLRLRGRIIESTAVGVVVADARVAGLPILDVNPAFEQITGWSKAEVLARDWGFLLGADRQAKAARLVDDALREGRDISLQLSSRRRDGSSYWNDLQLMAIRDAQGQVTHRVALISDATDRVRAAQELERREAYLRQVLNATHDGIIVTDEAGTIESFNAGAEAMFGWRAEQVIGRDVSLIMSGDDRRHHGEYMQRYLSTGESRVLGQEREFHAVRQDGQPLWVALRVGELPLPDHKRYIGVVHDITERRRSLDELRRAKEAAEDAANAKSDFLANMSHEIRTPMHGVLGSIELLRETALSNPQRRHLETAASSATLLLSVIDEILDFSRLEAGKLRIESIDFDLHRTVEDVSTMLSGRAHAKHLELACYIAPEVPVMVRGDPIRLRQVLVNLIGNAIKFTERGEVVLSVAAGGEGAGPDALRFQVRDTGIGIAATKQEHLFEPFTQADSSTSRRFGGSGLGLSICKRLVTLMKGEIGFTSTEGAGSTFWFQLPLQQPPAAGAEGAREANLSGTRVLVVDDNATNRVILHRYLTAWGGQSGSAASGDEALAKLQDAAEASRPYEVALLDLNMPGMDGYELVARIQADPALAGMPLIMLSSSMQDPLRMDGRKVDVWLDKPVRQSDLHDAIATVLNARPARAEAPPTEMGRARFNGERVLLVEDNAVTSDVGSQMLRRRGFQVSLASNGLAAVEAVRRAAFDIVLMDVQMPGMDGFEATRAIRLHEAATGQRRVPIVALTAHAMPADRGKCLAAGMDDYVVKPYSSETLATVIARWLRPPGVPAGEASPLDVIDQARLQEVRSVMGSDTRTLLHKVCDSLAAQLAELEAACADRQLDAAREVVHRMKNTAGDVGARALHELSGSAERALAANPPASVDLESLRLACREATEALQRAADESEPQA
jgi:two-component system, sensor histidine kinase and response regulator